MITPKAIILVVVNWLFRLLVYFAAVATAFTFLFGTPAVIKHTLVETHAYQRFVPATIQSNIQTKTGSLSLEDKAVQQIIIDSFPAQDLQIKAETVIDSFYDWLNGRTNAPGYRVDFAPNIELLADKLADYAMNRVAFLPVCAQQPAEFDPFAARCKPEFLDENAVRQELVASIRENNGLLQKTVFTAADLPKNAADKTIVEQYPQLPFLFRLGQLAPVLLCLLTLLGGVTIVWLSRSKRRALRQLSWEVLSSGVFIALSPLLVTYVIPQFTKGFSVTTPHGAQAVASDVSQALYTKMNTWLLIAGVMVAIIGLAILLLERATRPSSYAGVKNKAGLISSIEARTANGRFRLNPAKVPLQSSEISITKAPKRRNNKKYRKIPKGDL